MALAAWHGHFAVAEWLIETYNVDVNDRNSVGTTPLHRACFYENFDVIRLLCNHGADLFAKDNSGKTPQDEGTNAVRYFIKVPCSQTCTSSCREIRANSNSNGCIFA